MAVWFMLNLNEQRIGGVEIRRREPLDLSDPAALADVWSTYDVWRDGKHMGEVRHCYGNGAWKLVALATDLIAAADLPVTLALFVQRVEGARGSVLCDCYGVDSVPTNAKTGALMDHHCDCRSVVTAATLLGAYSKTVHAKQCGHGTAMDEFYQPRSGVAEPYPAGSAAAGTDRVHLVPEGSARTDCCDTPIVEVPSGERWTTDRALVNCAPNPPGGQS